MLHQSEIHKLSVLDISTGKILGVVRQIIFDPEGKRLAGVGFSTWTWGTRRYIHREDIRGIGDHAVTIISGEVAKPLTAHAELMQLTKNNIPFLGSQVITAGGKFLGIVEDYILDPIHYNLTEILLSDSLFQDILKGFGRVPVHCIVAIGRDAVVVQDDTTIKPNKKEAPSESVPRSSEQSSSEPIPRETSQDSNTPEATTKPLCSTSQRPFLVALNGKPAKERSISHGSKPKNRLLVNVRYLRRMDEVLGVQSSSVGHNEYSAKQLSSLLAQVISRGKLWLHRTISHSRPPNTS